MASTSAAATPSSTSAAASTASSSSSSGGSKPQRSPTFDLSQLPSVREDKISIEEEAKRRKQTCRFIQGASKTLKLPQVATATAMVFFHRFYAKHSFQKHDRFEVAVACILLAAKTEESPRKVIAVIDECLKLRNRAAAGRAGQSPSHTGSSPTASSPSPKSEEFLKLKERILLLERVVLHTIGFELSVDHPYKFIVDQIRMMIQKRQVEFISPPANATNAKQRQERLMDKLAQYAMNFANDSFETSLCIQFPSTQIAQACVYLAGQFAKTKADWVAVLEITEVEGFASICDQLIQLVSDKRPADKEALVAMRKALDELRKVNAGLGKSPPRSPQPPPPNSKRPRVN